MITAPLCDNSHYHIFVHILFHKWPSVFEYLFWQGINLSHLSLLVKAARRRAGNQSSELHVTGSHGKITHIYKWTYCVSVVILEQNIYTTVYVRTCFYSAPFGGITIKCMSVIITQNEPTRIDILILFNLYNNLKYR